MSNQPIVFKPRRAVNETRKSGREIKVCDRTNSALLYKKHFSLLYSE